MKASWEKLEKNEGILHIEVDKERVASALDQAFRKVVKKVNVPGFRRGKVPRHIFEARFGVESLYQDALDILLPECYMEAVKQTGIEPIDRPEVDIEQFEKGKELIFKAKVQVAPEVELGEYKGLEIPEKDFSVTDEDVQAELERMRERHAELIVIEDGEVQNGDTVLIDFEGFLDGKPFEGGKAENFTLEIGSGRLIPGFEEQLVGMKKDEEKEIEVKFPEDYHNKDLAGKDAVFKIKLHEIKRKRLPELDDEFAMDVSEFETLEEYKKDIEKNLKEQKEREKEQYLEATALEKAAENASVDIPQIMIDHEVDHMVQDFASQLRLQGMTLDMYFQLTGQDEQALREQMKENAEKRVRQRLVLKAIIEKEQITVSDEELDEELEKIAELYQRTKEEIRTMLEKNDALENVKQDVATRKAIRLLVENSKMVSEVA